MPAGMMMPFSFGKASAKAQCLLLIDLRRLLPVGIFPKPVI
jgi:hypothetical protein